MEDYGEPSVLEYARSQGIARKHQQLDPLELLGQIRDSEHAQSLSSVGSTSQLLDFTASDFANRTSVFTSTSEKFVLDKDGVKFLTSVLQEVTSLQAKPDHRVEDTISSKLKYKPRDGLKTDVPLLSADKENVPKALSKRTDPVTLLNETVPNLAEFERASIDEGLEFPDYFWELPSMLDRDPSTEKLVASESTAHVLSEAMAYLDENRHRKGVEEFVAKSILDMISPSQLSTPLYIESKEQHEQHVIPESRRSSDPDTGHGNEAVAEDVVIPDLFEEDTQLVGNNSSYVESEEQHECKLIPKSHLSSDAGTGHINKTVVERVVTPKPPREDNSLVGDVVPIKRTASPLDINETKEVAEISSRSGTALSPVPDSLTPFVGFLGTLSAFMQTRCHKNRRRKIGHESRYFSNTPKRSTKPRPDKLETPTKPTEHSKVLSSPVAMHGFQNVNLYPQYFFKESSTPLILIISAQLLRSHSTLVRSLEDISISRSVRLIFRDYQGAKSSQSQVFDEADLIVSPTTGIILANSHETTQKYLPGHGPPGIEYPLHARIVQSAPRYEMLYVLVGSPIETSMKILSSLKDLTTYCMLLNHICNIKVLLIAMDHVLEWILSITAKHTTDLHVASPLNVTKGRTCAPHFHDDQTQWEMLLRSAGLNPFAAQSVLALLKTSSTQSGRPEDVNLASVLSRFVEMPYQTRRHMFQEIVGQRVLTRVERVLEMDWQVDWAVDLT